MHGLKMARLKSWLKMLLLKRTESRASVKLFGDYGWSQGIRHGAWTTRPGIGCTHAQFPSAHKWCPSNLVREYSKRQCLEVEIYHGSDVCLLESMWRCQGSRRLCRKRCSSRDRGDHTRANSLRNYASGKVPRCSICVGNMLRRRHGLCVFVYRYRYLVAS